jgi:HEXXH motif-containing protein
MAHEINHSDAVDVRHAYSALATVRAVAPHAVDHVLDYPSVGAWATRTARLLHRRATATARPGYLAAVAAAAAVHGAVPLTIRLAPDPSRWGIHLPSLGVALVPRAGEEVHVRSAVGGSEVAVPGTTVTIPADPHQDGPQWQGTRKIAVSSCGFTANFLLDGWASAHLPPGLSGRQNVSNPVQVEQWRRRIAAGWDLLVQYHEEVAREVEAAIRVLTPLPAPSHDLVSATLTDAFGCVFLSLPPDARSVAITLTHELQHAKLTAIMDLFSLLEADTGEFFYAPWRNDPRPLVALLHGTYAHLGVAAFWRRQRYHEEYAAEARHAHAEYARWRRAAHEVAHVLLTSGQLTPTGCSFVAAMAQMLDRWTADPIPEEAVTLARQLAEEHRTRWLTLH